MRLPSNRGSAQLPGLALGKYRFRIADLAGRRVLAKQVAGIAVFGEVPFSTLFGEEEEKGVYATPQYSFPYAGNLWGAAQPAFTVAHNHCISVHIAFVGSYEEEYHRVEGTATVTVIQESRDPVNASAPFETIGSVDVELVPGQSWAVNMIAKRNPDGAGYLYYNGYAVCDSAEPFSH